MHDLPSPEQTALPRQRTRDPEVSIAFADGIAGDQLLHDLARALARSAARRLLATSTGAAPAADPGAGPRDG